MPPASPSASKEVVTAALLVVGGKILSGRTKDQNIGYIAEYLTAIGIDLKEVRVVGDEERAIVDALNALRHRYTYVFTTGGIGPTHGDITADCVAKAFGDFGRATKSITYRGRRFGQKSVSAVYPQPPWRSERASRNSPTLRRCHRENGPPSFATGSARLHDDVSVASSALSDERRKSKASNLQLDLTHARTTCVRCKATQSGCVTLPP
jgi:molybdenum cofactor synthesis domain-containing protein